MKYSLVIPCYNEATSLPTLVEQCKKCLVKSGLEIILVDNGSTDRTTDILKNLLTPEERIRSIRVEHNRGYGYGILAGLKASGGEIIGWTHADLQTDPQDVLEGLGILEREGAELFVKGRRYGRPLGDSFFTVGMSLFETLLLKKPLWDINAQPTLFPRSFFECWKAPPHDFSLDLYAYYQALSMGLSVRRFPVKFGPRAHGVSHWNIDWTSKVKFIRRTINFSLQMKRGL